MDFLPPTPLLRGASWRAVDFRDLPPEDMTDLVAQVGWSDRSTWAWQGFGPEELPMDSVPDWPGPGGAVLLRVGWTCQGGSPGDRIVCEVRVGPWQERGVGHLAVLLPGVGGGAVDLRDALLPADGGPSISVRVVAMLSRPHTVRLGLAVTLLARIPAATREALAPPVMGQEPTWEFPVDDEPPPGPTPEPVAATPPFPKSPPRPSSIAAVPLDPPPVRHHTPNPRPDPPGEGLSWDPDEDKTPVRPSLLEALRSTTVPAELSLELVQPETPTDHSTPDGRDAPDEPAETDGPSEGDAGPWALDGTRLFAPVEIEEPFEGDPIPSGFWEEDAGPGEAPEQGETMEIEELQRLLTPIPASAPEDRDPTEGPPPASPMAGSESPKGGADGSV